MTGFDPHADAMAALIADTLAGAPDVLARLDALTAGAPAAAARAARLRLLVALVNVRRIPEARALVAREGWENENFSQQPAGAHVDLDRVEIDALFALAVIHNEPGGDSRLSRRRFTRAMSLLRPVPGVAADPSFWAAVHGVVITSDRLADMPASAEALLAAYRAAGCDLAAMPAELAALWPARACDHFVRLTLTGSPAQARAFALIPGVAALLDGAGGEHVANVAFARAELEARPGGDPAIARRRFAELRAGLNETETLFWPALRGELAAIAREEGEPAAAAMARSVLVGRDPATVPHDIAARARASETVR